MFPSCAGPKPFRTILTCIAQVFWLVNGFPAFVILLEELKPVVAQSVLCSAELGLQCD